MWVLTVQGLKASQEVVTPACLSVMFDLSPAILFIQEASSMPRLLLRILRMLPRMTLRCSEVTVVQQMEPLPPLWRPGHYILAVAGAWHAHHLLLGGHRAGATAECSRGAHKVLVGVCWVIVGGVHVVSLLLLLLLLLLGALLHPGAVLWSRSH